MDHNFCRTFDLYRRWLVWRSCNGVG